MHILLVLSWRLTKSKTINFLWPVAWDNHNHLDFLEARQIIKLIKSTLFFSSHLFAFLFISYGFRWRPLFSLMYIDLKSLFLTGFNTPVSFHAVWELRVCFFWGLFCLLFHVLWLTNMHSPSQKSKKCQVKISISHHYSYLNGARVVWEGGPQKQHCWWQIFHAKNKKKIKLRREEIKMF